MRLLGLAALLVTGCVGDSAVLIHDDAGGPGQDGSSPPVDGAADTTTPTDAALTCDGGTVVLCGNACADLASSASNCGKCGHDCGGGTCSMGACQPVLVVDGLSHPVFDVDATSVYYSKDDKVLQCPKAGCKLQPKQLVAMTNPIYGSNDANGTLMIGANNFYFGSYPVQNTTRPSLYACGLNNCVNPTILCNSGLQGGLSGGFAHDVDSVYWSFYKQLGSASCTSPNTCTINGNEMPFGVTINTLSPTADSAGVYFIAPSGALQSCPLGATCSPTTLNAGPFGSNKFSGSLFTSYEVLATYNKVIYILHTGDEGGIPHGGITTCPTSGCPNGPSPFISKLPYPLLVTADADGVVWFNYDAASSADPAQIYTCPLSGCSGGPRLLATKQTGTAVLHTDDKFVYWATDTQIWRVAK